MIGKIRNSLVVFFATSAFATTGFSTNKDLVNSVFPEEGTIKEQAIFCITIKHANALAMDKAAKLYNKSSVAKETGLYYGEGRLEVNSDVEAVARTLQRIGGQMAYDKVVLQASDWEVNAKVLSETYYLPLMSNQGSSYTTHDGQVLLSAFNRCVSFFRIG